MRARTIIVATLLVVVTSTIAIAGRRKSRKPIRPTAAAVVVDDETPRLQLYLAADGQLASKPAPPDEPVDPDQVRIDGVAGELADNALAVFKRSRPQNEARAEITQRAIDHGFTIVGTSTTIRTVEPSPGGWRALVHAGPTVTLRGQLASVIAYTVEIWQWDGKRLRLVRSWPFPETGIGGFATL